MKAIVLSDIHGDDTTLRAMLEKAWRDTGHVDAYFCLGDGVRDFDRAEGFLRQHDPNAIMYAVKGNNDFGVDEPYSRVVRFGGASIYMTHGHRENVKMTMLSLDLAAQQADCAIALYGHTHCPDVETRRTMMINPGAACNGRLALLEVEDGQARVSLLRY